MLADTSIIEKEVSEFTKEVCGQIHEAGKRKKLKQEEVAEQLGISKYEFSDIENEEVEPSFDQIKQLTHPADELFAFDASQINEENATADPKQERWIKQLSQAPEDMKEAVKKVFSFMRGFTKDTEREDS